MAVPVDRGSALAPPSMTPQPPSTTAPVVELTNRAPSQTWQRSGSLGGRPGSVATAWRRSLAAATEQTAARLSASYSASASASAEEGAVLSGMEGMGVAEIPNLAEGMGVADASELPRGTMGSRGPPPLPSPPPRRASNPNPNPNPNSNPNPYPSPSPSPNSNPNPNQACVAQADGHLRQARGRQAGGRHGSRRSLLRRPRPAGRRSGRRRLLRVDRVPQDRQAQHVHLRCHPEDKGVLGGGGGCPL